MEVEAVEILSGMTRKGSESVRNKTWDACEWMAGKYRWSAAQRLWRRLFCRVSRVAWTKCSGAGDGI